MYMTYNLYILFYYCDPRFGTPLNPVELPPRGSERELPAKFSESLPVPNAYTSV